MVDNSRSTKEDKEFEISLERRQNPNIRYSTTFDHLISWELTNLQRFTAVHDITCNVIEFVSTFFIVRAKKKKYLSGSMGPRKNIHATGIIARYCYFILVYLEQTNSYELFRRTIQLSRFLQRGTLTWNRFLTMLV